MRARFHRSVPTLVLAALATAAPLATSCGDSGQPPTAPSGPAPPLPLYAETATHLYFCAAGDRIDTEWQETYHAWATARLGVTVPQRISYHKYMSRQEMGIRTGRYTSNAFAEPEKFAIHTLWATDNHEVVHVYTALIGRPTDFFNEGLAVSFQVDPAKGDFEARFNGEEVHSAARRYLDEGRLILPIVRIVETANFRAISDSVLAYREAGSFVRFLTDRYGIERVLAFFRVSQPGDSAIHVTGRFTATIGASLDEAERLWVAMLRTRGTQLQ
jgi:hypothetical protein